jgi:hypothetical protein
MKKDDARLAVLREYDRWAKAHPSKAKEMGGFVFFRYLEKERPDLLVAAPANGKSFTCGFVMEVDWKIINAAQIYSEIPRPLLRKLCEKFSR